MSYLVAADLNALGDATKLVFAAVDSNEEASVKTEIFSQVGQVYDTTLWVDTASTPQLLLKIMAMFYVGWHYQKVYSEDDTPNNFGMLLIARGQRLIDGLIDGSIDLPDVTAAAVKNIGTADYYPSDASSIMSPTIDDRSLGGPMFSMSDIF